MIVLLLKCLIEYTKKRYKTFRGVISLFLTGLPCVFIKVGFYEETPINEIQYKNDKIQTQYLYFM